MTSDEAVEAAFLSMYGPNPSNPSDSGDAHLLKELRKALEAAAPHMQTPSTQPGSDAILAILEDAGVDKADQFDALVAAQKLMTNPYRSQVHADIIEVNREHLAKFREWKPGDPVE